MLAKELALQRGDARLHCLQLGPDDQQQLPLTLPASLFPRRLLSRGGSPGVPRSGGQVVDRRHHQHELNAPAGNVEGYHRTVALGDVTQAGGTVLGQQRLDACRGPADWDLEVACESCRLNISGEQAIRQSSVSTEANSRRN